MFSTVAVLNRGEAAVRFMRAARTWSRIHPERRLSVLAFYTTPDEGAAFVRMASAAVNLGEPLQPGPDGTMRSAYLDVERVVRLCKENGADALWPGWGFLAESPELVDACTAAGITFIGPSAEAMRLLGDKEGGKRLAEANDVPVSAWSVGLVATPKEALKHAERIGYPVLLKATAGGGGRGIRIVHAADQLHDAFKSASSEAAAAFGNAGLLVEQFIPVARHVEVQVLADSHGTVWALGTRDCSLQRRHQKVLEEAPASGLSPEVERALCDAGIAVARASGYVGAGTAEFLVEPDGSAFYFLEMNTRLQVEHTVTECVYGVDLVAAQIDIAMGDKLPSAEPPPMRGHAVEARLNAEDADDGFSPSIGRIARFEVPQGPGIRVDSGFGAGDVIPSEFDSNVAKIIAWGADRDQAWARLSTALMDCIFAIAGGPTNRSLLLELSCSEAVRTGGLTTRWLDDYVEERLTGEPRANRDIALAAAAIGDHLRARRGHLLNFHADAQKGLPRRVPEVGPTHLRYLVDRVPVACTISTRGPACYRIECGEGAIELKARATGPRTFIVTDKATQRTHSVLRIGTPTAVYVEVDGIAHRFTRTSDGRVLAAIPAAVTRVHVQPGERVEAGDRLVTVEVMKMETAIEAPLSGVVTSVSVDIASRVAAGDLLVTIEGETGGDANGAAAAPEILPVMAAQDDDPARVLHRAFQGYDISDADIAAAIATLESGNHSASRTRLFELLSTAVVQMALFQTGVYDDARSADGDSSTDQLAEFVKHLELDDETSSERMRARLKEFLADHDVIDLHRSFELECALLRLFQANQAQGRLDKILFGVVGSLITADDDSRGPEDDNGRREILEGLANLGVLRNRQLAQAVWQAIYLLCDMPRHRFAVRRQGLQAQAALTDLVDPDCSEQQRAVSRTDLLGVPLGTLLELLQQSVLEPFHCRQTLLSVLMERMYENSRESEGEVQLAGDAAAVMITGDAGQRVLGVFVGAESDLPPLVRELPDAGAVDLLLGFSPDVEMLPKLFEGLTGDTRISAIWGTGEDGIRSRTYALNGGIPAEVELYRDLHPARATALEVDRVVGFECTRLPAPGGLFLALAAARDGTGDERLFAIGEVERVEPEPDGDGGVRLPHFEKTFLDAVFALRQAMRLRTGRDKLVWNRLTLFLRPEVKLTRGQMERVAERLAPPTSGLGLEKVVVRARIRNPDRPRAKAVDTIVEWSNPTGRGPTLSFALPRSRAIRVLSDYERRVVDARRRGKFYPYELIRSLTSTGSVGFAEGEFEELDLAADGKALESVYKRPYGQNQANLVVGRITNRVERFPDGLTRMLIVGDPTRTMGSLGEAECRRVIAALDMAADEGIPLEWVPISSGARISFDSGTENLDWTARVLRRIVEFTQDGGVINIIVDSTCVGAQSYWNAEATMLNHCRGALIMTPQGCMLLTGKRALEYSGSVAAATNLGIGGLDEIMGPNGQAQYTAPNLREAYARLFEHYALTYQPRTEGYTRSVHTSDPIDRDVTRMAYRGQEGFATIGEIFSDETNPGRKRPFAVREVLHAVVDQDAPALERWGGWDGAETAVVYHAQLGGQPVCVVGIESMTLRRRGEIPADGPDSWSSGTLFPQSSRKVARAIDGASGVAPVVVLANLSGFDGSPESLRRWQLEYGASIGRAVVNFDGPIVFCVIARYHGGAYVVFSQDLNDDLESVALDGTYASVIGGGPAAAVVFPGLVRRRTATDPRVKEERARLDATTDVETAAAQARFDAVYRSVEADVQSKVAGEFDGVHTVQRAKDVGSLSEIIGPADLRPYLVERVRVGIERYLTRA